MFGSQALETAIGLAVMFFVLAFAASSFVELLSGLIGKRAKDLEAALGRLLSGQKKDTASEAKDALAWFKGTSGYTAASVLTKKGKPSYLSAKAFADGIAEFLSNVEGGYKKLPAQLKARLDALAKRPAADATAKALAVKAGLEQWFDEAMGRLQGEYK